MQQEAGTLTTADGLTLSTRCWRPDGPARARVLIVHGLSEHSGRYAHVADHLVTRGFAVYAYDHRHHGRSEGLPRGLVPNFDAVVADLGGVLEWVATERSTWKTFVVAHSLGGAVAARFIVDHGAKDVDGLVLLSPAIRIPDHVAPVARHLGPLISRILPGLPLLTRDTKLISRDPDVRRAWRRDPLTYKGRLRAGTGAAILRNTRDLVDHADAVSLPLLVMHGTADRITDPDGSKAFVAAASSPDKTLKLYEGRFHELVNDFGREQVLEDVTAWLEARVGGEDERRGKWTGR